jgi:hypothetical protein
MKKLLILFMAFGLVAASCNNKGKSPLNDDRGKTNRDKDDYNNRDDEDNGNKNRDDDNNNGGGWSSKDKRSWMKMCADPLKDNMGDDRATNYCECVLEKIQDKYSSFQKANTQGTEEEGMEMGKECIRELGYQ